MLGSLAPAEQRLFLKFVTACSRAPLLGFRCARACTAGPFRSLQVGSDIPLHPFRYLEPQLCVQVS